MSLPAPLGLEPSPFFMLRTPLLPFEALEAWSAGLEGPTAPEEGLPEALARDRERLRGRLRALLGRAEVREALFIASPSLYDALPDWEADPDGKKGRRIEEALVRYVQRMASRPTPFGLFSGWSLGDIASVTRLRLGGGDRYRRHTRLDTDYLFALTEAMARRPECREQLSYRPNSSLYRAGGRLRYAESRLRGRARSYHLVAVDPDVYLQRALEVAGEGAPLREIAGAVVEAGAGEVSIEEAVGFVHELIDSQILVSKLSPAVTGVEPIHDVIDQLPRTEATGAAKASLEAVQAELETIDTEGLGIAPDRYRALARRLSELGPEVDLSRLFQVDMDKASADASLGPDVLDEMRRGVDLLHRLAPPRGEDGLSRFRRAFLERYQESQLVPLTEALDEEVGVGFGGAGSDALPLLDGLVFPQAEDETVPWGALPSLQLRKVEHALREGIDHIELAEADLVPLGPGPALPLPSAFSIMATLAAPSEPALQRGEFRMLIHAVFGPSGARFFGRFCHADQRLRRLVEEHLREEERALPDAAWAEVVHLPEGRLGNILSRPLVRPYEIPFLGRSGAPEERQIPVGDLQVTVSGGEIQLFSARLGRRVIPRLTSAHNFSARSLGIYRFLCSLQSGGVADRLSWRWGVLEQLPFLPQVTCGRLVLARARWRVTREELKEWGRGAHTVSFSAVQRWRRRRRMPRYVALLDGDNELLVDFDNVLSVESFAAVVRERPRFVLVEPFAGPGELCVRGEEGRFVHDLIVPFVRRSLAAARPPVAVDRAAPRPDGSLRRRFPPGSEWLYAKLYTGTATADVVLREVVGPLTHRLTAAGAVDLWFFVRYGDPHWHLRVRLHGEPARLQDEVLPSLTAATAPLLEDGRLWKLQLDTYEREVERYGGPHGVQLAERMAHADSEAVLEMLGTLDGDAGAVGRWQMALCGTDRWLADLGFQGEARLRVLRALQESFAREFRVDATLRQQLAERLRRERRALELLLGAADDADHALAPALSALRRRSERVRTIAAELRGLERTGQLEVPLERLAFPYVHMFNNRMLRANPRAQELVLYDLLYRLERSKVARAGR